MDDLLDPLLVADAVAAYRGRPELRSYRPDVRNRFRQGLMDALEGLGLDRDVARRLSTGVAGGTERDAGLGLVDLLPVGSLLDLQSARQRFEERGGANPLRYAGEAGLAALGVIPAYRLGKVAKGADLAPVGAIPYEGAGRPSSVMVPGRGRFEPRPIGALADAAEAYTRPRFGRSAAPESWPKIDEDRARRIAQAFDVMEHRPNDPRVRRAYDAMISETLDQYRALADTGIDIRFIPPGAPDPYAASPALGYADLVDNGRLWVFPTSDGFGTLSAIEDNPLLQRVGRIGDLPDATANDAFRVVHDVFGHFAHGNPFFRAPGEERAWLAHSRMYGPEALPAMTTETRGQNSWVNYGPFGERNRTASGADTVYADQKVGLLPRWATLPVAAMATPAAALAALEALEAQGEEFR